MGDDHMVDHAADASGDTSSKNKQTNNRTSLGSIETEEQILLPKLKRLREEFGIAKVHDALHQSLREELSRLEKVHDRQRYQGNLFASQQRWQEHGETFHADLCVSQQRWRELDSAEQVHDGQRNQK